MASGSELRGAGRYDAILKHIFAKYYKFGTKGFNFTRDDIIEAAKELGIAVPKNLGDVVYSYRYRKAWPKEIAATAPADKEWVIRPIGDALYRCELASPMRVAPCTALAESKLPDATPGIVALYAKGDEQALLARLRYNRMLDIFTGMACYSLQNHLRTKVPGMGQGEIDELYVGIDRRGAHFVFPVQAKGGKDQINLVQAEQDIQICGRMFPGLTCKPIAAQFMQNSLIAMFEFELAANRQVALVREKHYRLVPPDELTPEELARYAERSD